jgi:hypothetical protein
MASSKTYRRNKRRSCKGYSRKRRGGKSRSNTKKKNGTHKWHQKGCQSGGGSMTGGWPWGPSDVQHSGGGGGVGGQSPVPQSINGNHYSLNTNTLAPPQSSNHLVEKGQYGGKRRRSAQKRRRHHRRFIGEQHGGMAEYLPEVGNSALRIATGVPSNIVNTLQGASTAFVSRDPTVQPIGQPVQLK